MKVITQKTIGTSGNQVQRSVEYAASSKKFCVALAEWFIVVFQLCGFEGSRSNILVCDLFKAFLSHLINILINILYNLPIALPLDVYILLIKGNKINFSNCCILTKSNCLFPSLMCQYAEDCSFFPSLFEIRVLKALRVVYFRSLSFLAAEILTIVIKPFLKSGFSSFRPKNI